MCVRSAYSEPGEWMNVETADRTEAWMPSVPPRPHGLIPFILWAWHSWATRALVVGAIATILDIAVLLVCVKALHFPNPAGAMVGVLFGSTFTFFANRHFAFRDHNPSLAPQVAKFALATAGGMLAHAQVVYILADRLDVPVVLAKLGADLIVFTFGQMLLLRYFVFPRKKPALASSRSLEVERVVDAEPSI
ncbi:MAG TPA: GtrA family protein [Myxococcaceae bacterium]|nr:GtrA family protein [Myxococcaceae bacterium]